MYGTLADWRAWATARGNSAPTDASDADATAALVRTSDYIRALYVSRLLPGFDVTLQPPGYDHPLVDTATFIAAVQELTSPGFWTKTFTPAEQKVLTEVKGIKWTVTGSTSKTFSSSPISTLIDAMFDRYISDADALGFMLLSIGGGDACV